MGTKNPSNQGCTANDDHAVTVLLFHRVPGACGHPVAHNPMRLTFAEPGVLNVSEMFLIAA